MLSIIRYMKISGLITMWHYRQCYPDIQHYGVLGMKWGVRKNRESSSKRYNYKDKNFHKEKLIAQTKNGDTLTITEDKTPAFTRFLARHNKRVREELEKSKAGTIRDKDGNRIGELQLYKESPDSLNVVWLGVDDAYRGRGYATAVMQAATDFARDNGMKQITLEVPGISNDARHIYESQGFVAEGKISDEDDVWGGLTKMRKRL